MKIISKFKDYYDNINICDNQCNQDVIYIRKEQIYKLSKTELNLNLPYSYFGEKSSIVFSYDVQYIIGFCGKIYFLYKRNRDDINMYSKVLAIDVDTLDGIINRHNYKLENNKKYYKLIKSQYSNHERSFNARIQEFKNRENIIKEYILKQNYFISYNVPYFVIFGKLNHPASNITTKFLEFNHDYFNSIICNYNSLRDLRFFQLMQAYQAYQEIEMFFNSVLVKKENPLQIKDDVVLLESKGFDKKISFRHPIK